jgi:hypothetical protein
MASIAKDIDQLDVVRTNLVSAARENGESLASLSSSLGKNPAYLQQFVKRGSPRVLPEEIRYSLARLLSINESVLGGVDRFPDPIQEDDDSASLEAACRMDLRGFAQRLSAARQKAGYYSQAKFALKAEIPMSRYIVLEHGDDNPTIAELDAISATTGVSLNWLVKG